MVLDIHRDALVDSDGTVYKPVLQIDGVKTAQVMLLVGTDDAGATFPDWTEHLALAMEIQQEMNSLWPGLALPSPCAPPGSTSSSPRAPCWWRWAATATPWRKPWPGRLFARSAAKVLLARVGGITPSGGRPRCRRPLCAPKAFALGAFRPARQKAAGR